MKDSHPKILQYQCASDFTVLTSVFETGLGLRLHDGRYKLEMHCFEFLNAVATHVASFASTGIILPSL